MPHFIWFETCSLILILYQVCKLHPGHMTFLMMLSVYLFLHTHLTKFEDPGICRSRGKISDSHFVTRTLNVPRSHEYVDDIMCMSNLLCIHISQSSKVLALVESEIQHMVLILRLVCTQVAWPGWWHHVFNYFIINVFY